MLKLFCYNLYNHCFCFLIHYLEDSSNILNLNEQNHATFHFNTDGIDEKIFFEFRTRKENQIMFSFGKFLF